MPTTSIEARRLAAFDPGLDPIVEGLFAGEQVDALRILGLKPIDAMEWILFALDDDEMIEVYQALRAPGDAFNEVKLSRTDRKEQFGYYGLEAVRAEEDVIAEGYRPGTRFAAAQYQARVRQAMMHSQEVERIALLTDPATYSVPGNSLDLTGAEWDIPTGDLLGNVEAVIGILKTSSRFSRKAMTLWLPNLALDAAYADSGFRAALAATASALALINPNADPKLEALTLYLGVECRTDFEHSTLFVGAAQPTATDAWGDAAILYVDHEKAGPVVSGLGIGVEKRFGYVLQNTRFAAQRTIFDQTRDVFRYRRKMAQRSLVAHPELGFLFRNVNSGAV